MNNKNIAQKKTEFKVTQSRSVQRTSEEYVYQNGFSENSRIIKHFPGNV